MMVIVSLARSTIIHFEKRVLTLAAQHIDREIFRLAHNPRALLDGPQQHIRSANALHQHSTYTLRNFTERLKRVVRLLETVLVVDVEVSRHRFIIGVSRVNRVMICKGKEISEEFLNHRFKFFFVELLLR